MLLLLQCGVVQFAEQVALGEVARRLLQLPLAMDDRRQLARQIAGAEHAGQQALGLAQRLVGAAGQGGALLVGDLRGCLEIAAGLVGDQRMRLIEVA